MPWQENVYSEFDKVIFGQKAVIEKLLIALISGGHVLLEGVPGLAKTLMIKTLAQLMDCSFARIQFTPDLLPSDLIGTTIYHPAKMEFQVKKGPLFHQMILADEINRSPSKVQSALLEAMQEYQITIGDETFKLARPFFVFATQNPIEQEGTYPLPEAQIDRFMMKILLQYPEKNFELQIMDGQDKINSAQIQKVLNTTDLEKIKTEVAQIHVDPKIKDYIYQIVEATRRPGDAIKKYITYGVSPRGSIALYQAAKAMAYLQGRGYVTPSDVKTMVYDVLRHRLVLSYQAQAAAQSPDQILEQVLASVVVP